MQLVDFYQFHAYMGLDEFIFQQHYEANRSTSTAVTIQYYLS